MPSVKFSREPLSWPAAEQAFADRLEMASVDFYALADYCRGSAWTITRIAEMQTVGRAKRKLLQIIKDGEILEEFIAWAAIEDPAWTAAYTELIFRMAVLGGYSRARWDEINDPDLGDEFDWLMYDAVDDDRARIEHAAMDGQAWRRDEFPDGWWPPNGFNCRCSVRNLNEDLLARSGADTGGSHPVYPAEHPRAGQPVQPAEGFRANQARDFRGTLESELERIRDELTN